MAEEFLESEVIFQENTSDYEVDCDFPFSFRESKINKGKRKKLKTNDVVRSVPVNIPENLNQNVWMRFIDSDSDDDKGEFVPPHVIVGRHAAVTVMAFSVFTGNGRTLKGRDLSEVRNSILRMTGFLET